MIVFVSLWKTEKLSVRNVFNVFNILVTKLTAGKYMCILFAPKTFFNFLKKNLKIKTNDKVTKIEQVSVSWLWNHTSK